MLDAARRSGRFHHPLPFGAELRPDGVTQFRLWAPAQTAVSLVLTGARERILPMTPECDGWFALAVPAAAGARYHYQLQNGQRVPDPASRFQPDDVHAPSEVIDPTAYEWRHADWRGRPWEEVVLYEAHVGAFTPEGTFDAFCKKLDHLARLGVTAVELMPLADFEGHRNWGYDGVLPFAPDAAYGRPEDLKRLIDEAHGRNLMVFLDVVYNHFGPSGNYLSLTAPGFFTERYKTPWGAAMNFDDRAAEVRRFFIENAKYWLHEYRFDGLRLDAVHAIRDAGTPHILTELAADVRAGIPDGRHVHLVLENADNTSRWLDRATASHYDAQWNDDFHHAAHVISSGETHGYYGDFAAAPVEALAKSLATGFVYQGQPSPHWDGRPRGEPSAHLPATAFVNFLQNHDQIGNRADAKRRAALVPRPALRALTAILLLAPEIPMLFMGEEWASARPFHFFCDFAGDLRAAVRKGRQDEFAHMRRDEPGGAEAARIDPNDEAIFRQSQLDWSEPESGAHAEHLALVRELLDLRRRQIVPRLARLIPGGAYEVRGEALRVMWRFSDGAALTLIANLSDKPPRETGWRIDARRIFATSDAAHLTDWGVIVALAESPP